MPDTEKLELPVGSDDDFVLVNESDAESKQSSKEEAVADGGSASAQEEGEPSGSSASGKKKRQRRKKSKNKSEQSASSASASPSSAQRYTTQGVMAPKKNITSAGTPAPKKKSFRQKNNAILPTPAYYNSPSNRGYYNNRNTPHFGSPTKNGHYSGGYSPTLKQKKKEKKQQQGPKWNQLKSDKTPAIVEVDQPLYTVGVVESCWRKLTGVPRQAGLCPHAESRIRVAKHFAANGALDGLEGYSHVWVLWMFHKNVTSQNPKKSRADTLNLPTKIRAPKLYLSESSKDVAVPKIGVFATRSPHRPCPIGLSVVKIESIDKEAGIVNLVGGDMVDGTPIIDIKPYHPVSDVVNDAFAPDWVMAACDEDEARAAEPDFASISDEAEEQFCKLADEGRLFLYGKGKGYYAAQAVREALLLGSRDGPTRAKKLAQGEEVDKEGETFSLPFDAAICTVEIVAGGKLLVTKVELDERAAETSEQKKVRRKAERAAKKKEKQAALSSDEPQEESKEDEKDGKSDVEAESKPETV